MTIEYHESHKDWTADHGREEWVCTACGCGLGSKAAQRQCSGSKEPTTFQWGR